MAKKAYPLSDSGWIILLRLMPDGITFCPLGLVPVSKISCQKAYDCFPPNTVLDISLFTHIGSRAKLSRKLVMLTQS